MQWVDVDGKRELEEERVRGGGREEGGRGEGRRRVGACWVGVLCGQAGVGEVVEWSGGAAA